MKEEDIRPAALFQKYLELSAADAVAYFVQGERQDLPCHGCGREDVVPAFTKQGILLSQRFIRTLLERCSETQAAFQRFLSEHRLTPTWA